MKVPHPRVAPDLQRVFAGNTVPAAVIAAIGGSEPFDRITRIARRLLGAEAALISLIDEDAQRQVFLGQEGLSPGMAAEGGTHIDQSFCRYAVASGERLVVSDARNSALLSESSAVSERGIISYAGSPLRLSPHEPPLGTLCVIGSSPRAWTAAELELLDELAELARTELDYRLRLTDTEELEQLALRLPNPMGRLGEAVRRVCTLVEDPADPRLPRSADVTRERVQAVEVLVQDLVRVAEKRREPVPPQPRLVDLTDTLRQAMEVARTASRADVLHAAIPDEPLWVRATPSDLHQAVVHAVVAALHHAVGLEPAQVEVGREGDLVMLIVRSPGYALPVAEALRLVDQFRVANGDEAAVDVAVRGGVTRVSSAGAELLTGGDGTTLRVRLELQAAPGPAVGTHPSSRRTHRSPDHRVPHLSGDAVSERGRHRAQKTP